MTNITNRFKISLVCTIQVGAIGAVIIRSYENIEAHGSLTGAKIWEAARATSAASTFFEPISIGDHGERFTDGALIHNNPVFQVYKEA